MAMAVVSLLGCTSLEGLTGGLGDDGGVPPAEEAGRDSASSVDANVPTFRPAAGLYSYVGTGTDRLIKPDGNPLAAQNQGPTMQGTVTHIAADCYSFSLSLANTHLWRVELCQRGASLYERAGTDDQSWFNGANKNLATWQCSPENLLLGPIVERDKQVPHLCEGKNTNPANSVFKQGGLLTFLGREVKSVNGVDVPVVHVIVKRTVSGNTQNGTQELELWLDAVTSLPIQGNRSSDVVTPGTIIGDIRYTEKSGFQLQSITPTAPDAGVDAGVDGGSDASRDAGRG